MVLACRTLASAEEPANVEPRAEELERAKQLFRQGNAMRKAGDFQRALELYLESRAIVPSVANTSNAAYCLDKLGRSAEALELHEELLTRMSAELTQAERDAIAASMAALRPSVGSIEVSANVTGLVVIDGRMRGSLPLPSPIRVMPGPHTLRVMKDGFDTFENEVEVRAGETVPIDARLTRLARAGRLSVKAAGLEGARLFIDGAPAGTLPWEGTLATGTHLYWIEKADQGTAPRAVVLLEGRSLEVAPVARPLSAELRIVVEPPEATLSLDGVVLGKRGFVGRLPVGKHVLEARDEGYVSARLEPSVTRSSRGEIRLALRVDERHPRWRKATPARSFAEAYAGSAFGPGLGSGAEAFCDSADCATNGWAIGALGGVLAGYELTPGFAVEAGLGYAFFHQKIERAKSERSGAAPDVIDVRWTWNDAITLHGPFVGAGASYGLPLTGRTTLEGRLHLGALLARTRDVVTASASAGGDRVDATVEGSGKVTTSVAPFLMPSLGVRMPLGSWHMGVGIAAVIFPVGGPENDHGETRLPACDPAKPVTCARRSEAVARERSHGPFALFWPRLALGKSF